MSMIIRFHTTSPRRCDAFVSRRSAFHEIGESGRSISVGAVAFICLALLLGTVHGQEPGPAPNGQGFSYQGRLEMDGLPANGRFDFAFQLHADAKEDAPVCGPFLVEAVPVADGVFTVLINPECANSPAFDGQPRWLEMQVREANGNDSYLPLAPRQLVTPAPYAHFALRAGQAEWQGLTGIPASFADGQDDDTTYGAGPGLELSKGQFRLAIEGVGSSHLMPSSVTAVKIADAAITRDKLGLEIIEEHHFSPDLVAILGDRYWKTLGNANTTPGIHFLGTTDNRTFDIRVNNARALRIEPNPSGPNHIAGAFNNRVLSGAFATTIGGGLLNTNGGDISVVGGGRRNFMELDTLLSVIGGGEGNSISNAYGFGTQHATISGGSSNRIQFAFGGTLGGGAHNRIEEEAHHATIAGGLGNLVSDFGLGFAARAFIGGGMSNVIASAGSAAIVGGVENHLGENASFAFIGGGYRNDVIMDASYSVIAGGRENWIGSSTTANTIGGGWTNVMDNNVNYGFVGGGRGNHLIDGGAYNVISGGRTNEIGGFTDYSTVAGGAGNKIGDFGNYGTVGGGRDNQIDDNANYATIPGGRRNEATDYGFAAGRRARAVHTGAFVWGDATDDDVSSSANNQFTVRASGGIRLFTSADLTAGVQVAAGGTGWGVLSDRNAKENFQAVDVRQVLDCVVGLPISRWNMKSQDPSVVHMGPMAQDFHVAFGLGEDERRINTVDADGVALAAIQGLNQKLEEEIATRDERIAELEFMLLELKAEVAVLARPAKRAAR